MIHDLLLRNFKCFREQTIPFGGLTVLAGVNGAGKSSAIQAILVLAQLRDKTSTQSPWRGPLVNLGSFRDVLHDDADNDTILIRASFGERSRVFLQSDGEIPPHVQWHAHAKPKRYLRTLFYLSADRLGPSVVSAT